MERMMETVMESRVGASDVKSHEGADGPMILVVDDQSVERRIAGHIAERMVGLRPIYAGDGREALRLLACESVAVVLTDLQMPKMDGLELVATVREKHRTSL
jgi:CheY-like chemotaxis protein